MSDPIDRAEAGTTRLFTATYSSAPWAAQFFVTTGSAETVVYSTMATALSAVQFEAAWTCPMSAGFYVVTFTASYTNGYDVMRTLVQVVRTTPE